MSAGAGVALPHRTKLLLSASYMLGHFCVGLTLGLKGPALLAMATQLERAAGTDPSDAAAHDEALTAVGAANGAADASSYVAADVAADAAADAVADSLRNSNDLAVPNATPYVRADAGANYLGDANQRSDGSPDGTADVDANASADERANADPNDARPDVGTDVDANV